MHGVSWKYLFSYMEHSEQVHNCKVTEQRDYCSFRMLCMILEIIFNFATKLLCFGRFNALHRLSIVIYGNNIEISDIQVLGITPGMFRFRLLVIPSKRWQIICLQIDFNLFFTRVEVLFIVSSQIIKIDE